MKPTGLWYIGMLGILVVLLTLVWVPGFALVKEKENLISVKVTLPPKLDGSGDDDAWRNVPELKVRAKNGPEISLRSIHTSDRLYMLVSWEDATESIKKNMWVHDGTKWDQMKELRVYEVEPTKVGEDRLAFNWPINNSVIGFSAKGCLLICHDSGRFSKRESRMATNSPKEFIDQWHWKAARTNPIGYADDKWMDNKLLTKTQVPNLKKRREAAQHGDDKGDGNLNYSDNKTKDGKPKFVRNGGLIDDEFLKKEDATPIDYSKTIFQKGNAIPGYILARPNGSRGDVDAKGVWKDGSWTLEISRKLLTEDRMHDVQFDDLKKTYYFGIAVFDNDGANAHTRPLDPIGLMFK